MVALPHILISEPILESGAYASTIMVAVPESVRTLYDRGRALYPGITLGLDAFAAAIAARELPVEPRPGELLLAVALAAGDAGALATFEAELVPRLRATLAVVERDPAALDELVQEVRVRALVGAQPRIMQYSGAGSLLAWFKVMAVRLRADRYRAARTTGAPDPADPDLIASGLLAPERAALQAQWGSRIEDALGAALRSLGPRDRSLLRFHYVDGLSLAKLGAIYGRDKATVSRWLARVRAALIAAIAEAAGETAQFGELVSVARQLLSRLDISLSALHSQTAGEP